MILNRKNNHTNGISVSKLVKNEILHEILGLLRQKIKIQDGIRQPSCFDPYMTLNHKNNHTSGISAFKLVKNEVLHKIRGLFCQKLKIQYGRRQPSWF